ncbi:mitotic spindle assembly checkpoint protein-like protein MAD1 [Aureobasidium pullulans]|nr:mitotic spindle assembly checkpoint protein-like protein MAD1 [Aureobasidium pullulans]THY22994.1 mitotic spindle assembly checkpoint protein-like protein MAD1 [Aureobasidium pullulans]THZ14571.1 mitotic spindle assembly checkpoint protein-like protein MAD1 [Aureobasidium pullulans]
MNDAVMARNAIQPSFDFFTGEERSPARQPLRETFRQSTATVARPDIANESLRAQLNTLQYELDSLKQEKELTALQQASEIRDAEQRAERDFKRAQAAESTAQQSAKKLDQLTREVNDIENRHTNEKIQLERKIRTLQDDNQSLREDLEDAESRLSSAEREHKHGLNDIEARHSALQASFEEAQRDLESKVSALQSTQQRLSQRESETGDLENEILRLKAQTGDSETLGIIKRELSEQVAHIKRLESTNRDQSAELKQLRKTHKSVEIVQEEKRALEQKVRAMEDLRKELAEAQLQKQILEDERRSWTSYLESEAAGREEMTFDSPEDMAKAFVNERMERFTLIEKLGAIQPELTVRDANIKTLEDEKVQLRAEIEKLKGAGTTSSTAAPIDAKARARLERQKNLAIKEVEYLRAQMKAFEAEENEFQPEKANQEENKRTQELEALIDQYRSEVEALSAEMKQLESSTPAAPTQSLKRPHEEESDERLGEMRRKTRTLQDDLTALQTRYSTIETELKAKTSQLNALRESSRTRVLELRDNPTAQAEAIKMTTLRTLKEENAALLEQLEGRPNGATKVVPISTLDHARLQMSELEAAIAQRDKKQLRLKSIWSAKFLEFAEAVAATLGWKVVFQPNGRFKVTSILYPTSINKDGEEEENSILFDGEKGTMKVSGGTESVFANEIRPLIEFWVDGRKEIPCFLAACTLEFYDKTTRAAEI